MTTLTAQKVIAILKKAGFAHAGPAVWSEAHRGYVCQREGFRTWCKAGKVTVEHWFVGRPPEGHRATRAERVTAYQRALEEAGLAVEVRHAGDLPYWLMCTTRGLGQS